MLSCTTSPAQEGSGQDRKSTRLNSSHSQISYAVFCLKKKTKTRYSVLNATTSHLHTPSLVPPIFKAISLPHMRYPPTKIRLNNDCMPSPDKAARIDMH